MSKPTLLPRRKDAKRDPIDHTCTVCGLPWPDRKETLSRHVCPPGFRTVPVKRRAVSKPICIHAWLARDADTEKRTRLHLSKPDRCIGGWTGGDFYWVGDGHPMPVTVSGTHGLRPGQIKRVIIVEDEE